MKDENPTGTNHANFTACDYNIELLFQEWKSYANLHAFDTEKPAIVEGLIWAAIAAAALKRFECA